MFNKPHINQKRDSKGGGGLVGWLFLVVFVFKETDH